jgi:hypothetical protein
MTDTRKEKMHRVEGSYRDGAHYQNLGTRWKHELHPSSLRGKKEETWLFLVESIFA